MDVRIEFHPSAFKHRITEADIRWAVKTFIYEEPSEDEIDKYLLIGFDTKGNLLEIMYNTIDEQTIHVFHAMKCRSAYIPLLNL
jgi:hypothetical protein